MAGLPNNIDFLTKLANHKSFEDGNLETHFIEHFKDDLFDDPTNSALAKEAYDDAKHFAALVAACKCKKEHRSLQDANPGKFNILICFVYIQLG